ncbi:MAG: hypothetical protein HYV63_16470 [Candidatus Schekmanbacteria bacterium]|nr:hypothetical protein [Candidatus Schekmanbacteria bacterium]
MARAVMLRTLCVAWLVAVSATGCGWGETPDYAKVKLKSSGGTLSGLVVAETSTAITLRTGENARLTIKKSNIARLERHPDRFWRRAWRRVSEWRAGPPQREPEDASGSIYIAGPGDKELPKADREPTARP